MVDAHKSPEPEVENKSLRIALVCMPFSMADRPSIQVGLLTAIARQAGFQAESHHLNLDLAAQIPDAYEGLCSHRGRLTGEWLFSIAAFGADAQENDQAYFDAFPEEVRWAEKGNKNAQYLSWLRHTRLPKFIDDCLVNVDWGKYDVIGFTSTFQQNAASIALSRRIKSRFPDVKIVFGGANMEDEMGLEYARAFPFIDFVVIGEGDDTFPALLRQLARGEPINGLPGLGINSPEGFRFSGQPSPVLDLDRLPIPDYTEYFERLGSLKLKHRDQWIFAVPFESSRGCWWGQKHHCTFCGLNGSTMRFRAKSPRRVLSELTTLMDRHQVSMFQATDNIMDMDYVKEVFSLIEKTRTDYQFFYEIKSNLTREQIRVLRYGGVRWLQPGIESLSTRVLKLMRKGCSMLQNVRLLKWANYYRIRVGWNLLWGFPGEHEEDYVGEFEVLKLLSHLEPPNSCGRIWMERFSPIYFDRQQFSASCVRPEASYAYVYPDYVDLSKVAYFFDCELDDTLSDSVHVKTQELVQQWKDVWNSSDAHTLSYRRTLDSLFIDDGRGEAFRGTHTFSGPAAAAYEYCGETMRSSSAVTSHLAVEANGHRYDREEVRSLLDEFCRRGLMVCEDDQYLALALPANPNW
jgi:ribosomal peptide maturation radical SAM protein 1